MTVAVSSGSRDRVPRREAGLRVAESPASSSATSAPGCKVVQSVTRSLDVRRTTSLLVTPDSPRSRRPTGFSKIDLVACSSGPNGSRVTRRSIGRAEAGLRLPRPAASTGSVATQSSGSDTPKRRGSPAVESTRAPGRRTPEGEGCPASTDRPNFLPKSETTAGGATSRATSTRVRGLLAWSSALTSWVPTRSPRRVARTVDRPDRERRATAGDTASSWSSAPGAGRKTSIAGAAPRREVRRTEGGPGARPGYRGAFTGPVSCNGRPACRRPARRPFVRVGLAVPIHRVAAPDKGAASSSCETPAVVRSSARRIAEPV